MKIDIKLVQDTYKYLSTCPWAQVDGLIQRWGEVLNQPTDVKPEEEPDGEGA